MDRQQLTPGTAHLLGLLLIAAGILPMLAAFDVGPLRQEDINGPPWIGFVAGGIFAAGGAALIAGPQAPLAGGLFGVLAAAGLAAIGNWVAFGAGERACAGSNSLPWLSGAADVSGLACRLPFGFCAVSPPPGLITCTHCPLLRAFTVWSYIASQAAPGR